MFLKSFKVDAVLIKVTIVTETESNSTPGHKHLEGGSSEVTR